jgi:hypothetical protein
MMLRTQAVRVAVVLDLPPPKRKIKHSLTVLPFNKQPKNSKNGIKLMKT